MAYTLTARKGVTAPAATTQPIRIPVGNRVIVIGHVNAVAPAGDSVDVRPFGISEIDIVVPAVAGLDGGPGDVAATTVQVRPNSVTDLETEDDPGQFWISTTAAGPTVDVLVLVVGKV